MTTFVLETPASAAPDPQNIAGYRLIRFPTMRKRAEYLATPPPPADRVDIIRRPVNRLEASRYLALRVPVSTAFDEPAHDYAFERAGKNALGRGWALDVAAEAGVSRATVDRWTFASGGKGAPPHAWAALRAAAARRLEASTQALAYIDARLAGGTLPPLPDLAVGLLSGPQHAALTTLIELRGPVPKTRWRAAGIRWAQMRYLITMGFVEVTGNARYTSVVKALGLEHKPATRAIGGARYAVTEAGRQAWAAHTANL